MKYLDLILEYLNGNLNSEDSAKFERDLLIYNDLLTEFEEVLNLLDVIREEMEIMKEISPSDDYREDLMGLLDAVYGINSSTGEILPDENNLVSDIPRIADKYSVSCLSRFFGKRFLAAAAIMVLIISLNVISAALSSLCSNDALFEKFHNIHYFSVSRSQMNTESINSHRQYISKLFNSDDFSSVVKYAESSEGVKNLDADIILSVGVSYLMMGNYPKAIEYFEMIDNNTLFYYPAMWEISLSYLKAGQTERSIEIMNSLRKLDSVYEKDIRKLKRCIRIRDVMELFTIRRTVLSNN